jgi:hypothetical protein
MRDHEAAVEWLVKKGWHVTELRVRALMAGVDFERETGGCSSWSDGGPCQTCIGAALEDHRVVTN